MTIAFGAILIFLLVAPGAILRASYLAGPFSKRFIRSSPTDVIFWAIVPGLALHVPAIFLAEAFTNYKVNLQMIGGLLTGEYSEAFLKSVAGSLRQNFGAICSYYLLTCFLAFVLGHAGRGPYESWASIADFSSYGSTMSGITF